MGHLRRLIAFDLDGTLIDSRRDLADAANQLIEELGGAPLPEEAVGRMVGNGAAVLVQRALTAAGQTVLPGALERFLEIYDGRLLNHTRPYEGALDAVRLARKHAWVAVLTNKPRSPSVRILEALGFADSVDEVIGGDGPYPRKPDPAGLVALMARADAAREATLLVGDSPVDYETAIRAGVRCCLVSYGFGFEHFRPGGLPDREWLAHSGAELHALIDRFAAVR